jgi:hypothetical protein
MTAFLANEEQWLLQKRQSAQIALRIGMTKFAVQVEAQCISERAKRKLLRPIRGLATLLVMASAALVQRITTELYFDIK